MRDIESRSCFNLLDELIFVIFIAANVVVYGLLRGLSSEFSK
jgi:hypothetical protein